MDTNKTCHFPQIPSDTMAADMISQLPREILLQVMDNLRSAELKHVSSLNTYFRSLATTRLFRCITLHRDIRCMVNNLLEPRIITNYGHNIRTIIYDCEIYPDNTTLLKESSVIADLLSGRLLENVTDIRLAFSRRYYLADLTCGINANLQRERSDSATHQQFKERTSQWRRSVTRAFEALSENHRLQRLELRGLVPLNLDIWTTAKWRALLLQLTSFRIDIRKSCDTFGWDESSTLKSSEYRAFIAALQPSFFHYLISVRHLHLAADCHNMLGCKGRMHIPLPISNGHFPLLQELVLQDICIDSVLASFLCHKQDHIRSVKLLRCFATRKTRNTKGAISWESFFASMRKSSPRHLTEFHISEADLRTRPPSLAQQQAPDDSVHQRLELVLEAMQKRKKKSYRLFAYGQRNVAGLFQPSGTRVLKSLRDGKDQDEYDTLMKLVEENRMQLSRR